MTKEEHRVKLLIIDSTSDGEPYKHGDCLSLPYQATKLSFIRLKELKWNAK